jgi:hypothetical protein
MVLTLVNLIKSHASPLPPTFLYRLQEINKSTVKPECNDMNVVGLLVKIVFSKTVKGKQMRKHTKAMIMPCELLS